MGKKSLSDNSISHTVIAIVIDGIKKVYYKLIRGN